jgi:hypothetical protein
MSSKESRKPLSFPQVAVAYFDKIKSREVAQSAGLYLPGEATLLAALGNTILSDADIVKCAGTECRKQINCPQL